MKLRSILSVILICIFGLNAFSQIVITSQKTIGGSLDDFFSNMCYTKDGGVLLGGTSYSNKSYEKSQNIRGNGDYWVVKLDAHGKIQWDKTIGGMDNDNLKSVIQTSDGGYAIIGTSLSNTSVEKSEDSRGSSDYWLVKLDSAGNIQWDKTIGGSGTEYIDNIVQTSDDGYILAGSSNSNISGEKTENSRGGFDYWIVKLNKNGKKIWDKTIGGSADEFCSPFAVTNDGGLIIGGFSSSDISGEKTENSRGGFDDWLVKLDRKGNIQWDKTIGGSADEYCHGIYETADGGYVLGGSSLSGISGDKTEYDRGGADYWTVKINKNRKVVWDKTIGGSGDDWCNNMIHTSGDEFVLVGGSLSDASGDKSEFTRGGADYWIVTLNCNGKLVYEKTVGGYADDWGYSVVQKSVNELLVGGFSSSPEGADKTGFNRGYTDYWIVNLKNKKSPSLADTTENTNSKILTLNVNNKMFVYPNPANNILNVHTNNKATLSITDQSGKIIATEMIDSNGTIDVSKFSSGVYYIRNNATGEAQKFLITRKF